MQAATEGGGCGGSSKTARTPHQFEVPNNHTLYGFSENGTLYRGTFNGGPWKKIQPHEFEGVDAQISPDGRWIAYGGDLAREFSDLIGNPNANELWLFDTRTQRSRRIMQRPFASMITVNTVFSPDSRYAATFASFDSRTPDDQRSGLFLTDLTEGTTSALGFSQQSIPGKGEVYGSPSWSRDRHIYLLYRKDGDFEYTSIDPSNGRSHRISGRYIEDEIRHEFIENGKAVSIQDERDLPSRYSLQSLASPGGTNKAEINAGYELTLSTPDAARIKIDEGRYDMCEGIMIGIVGWLDEDYLLYKKEGEYFVYQMTSGHSRRIDLGPLDPMNIFWGTETAELQEAASP